MSETCSYSLASPDWHTLMLPIYIKEAFDGSKWIMTHRQKTGVAVNVPLLDYPLAIIEKYKGQCPVN